jgi:hypothetical protein
VAALLVLLSALTPLAQRRVLMAVFPLQYASTNPYATSCEFELCQAALAVCDISSVEELTKSIEKLNDRQVALREQATIAVAEHEQELVLFSFFLLVD